MHNRGILIKEDIAMACKEHELIIEPFEESHLQPSSYDISVSQVLMDRDVFRDFDEVNIEHLQFINLVSEARFEFPLDITGHISFRTTYRKMGLLTDLGRIEAGWKGRLIVETFNASKLPIVIKRGDRIATVEFIRLAKPVSSSYKGQFQQFGV